MCLAINTDQLPFRITRVKFLRPLRWLSGERFPLLVLLVLLLYLFRVIFSSLQYSPVEVCLAKICLAKICLAKICPFEVCPAKICPFEEGATEDCIAESSPAEVCVAEVSIAKESSKNNSINLSYPRPDGIVPIAMESSWQNGKGRHLFIRYLASGGIGIGVELALHRQASLCRGRSDQLHDYRIASERLAAPVLTDPGKEAMLNLVPFARAWRQA